MSKDNVDMEEIISVVRVLVYTGSRKWVFTTLNKSRVRGDVNVGTSENPQIIMNASEYEVPKFRQPLALGEALTQTKGN